MKPRRTLAVLSACMIAFGQGGQMALAETSEGAQPSAAPNLDLGSTEQTMSASSLLGSANQAATIDVGGAPHEITSASLLTPAQYVAVSQVLSSGVQSLLLGAQGNATGGSFELNAALGQISGLLVPQGVTGINNIAAGSINLTGNLTNSGSIFAVSTSSAMTTATIVATNITNQPGGLISTVLPSSGVPGFANLVSNLNLSLIASNSIVNAGVLSSAGSLTMQAPSIVNMLPNGVSGPSPVMQALGQINISTQSLVNAGTISSINSNINMISAGDSLRIANLGGRLEALAGTISIANSTECILQSLNIADGELLSQVVDINTPHAAVSIDVNTMSGVLNMSTGTAVTVVRTGELNLGRSSFTGDPLFYDLSGAAINLGNVSTTGNPLIVVSAGDINADFLDTTASNGGELLLVAGANVTGCVGPGCPGPGLPAPSGVTLTLSGFNATGSINVSGNIFSNGTAGSGGNVTLVAPGSITTGSIQTDGVGSPSGNIKVIAGQSAGTAISLGTIDTGAGTAGGAVQLDAASPTVAAPLAMDAICNGCASAIVAGAPTSAQILLNDGMQAASGDVFITANSGNLTVLGNVTAASGSVFITANQFTVGDGTSISSDQLVQIRSASGQDLQFFGPSNGSAAFSGGSGLGQGVSLSAPVDRSISIGSAGAGPTSLNVSGPLVLATTALNAPTSITVDSLVSLQSDSNMSILFISTAGGTLTNNGAIESTSGDPQASITTASSGDLTLAGSGNMRFNNGGVGGAIAFSCGPVNRLNVAGTQSFSVPDGFVQFLAFNGGASVNFLANSLPVVTSAEHVLIATHMLNFDADSRLDAGGANHIFIDPGFAGPTITITLPTGSTARVTGRAIEVDEPPSPLSQITFSSSVAGTPATLLLDGGPSFVFGSSITVDPFVTINSVSQNLVLVSPTVTVGDNAQVGVTGIAGSLILQSLVPILPLNVTLGVNSQLTNTTASGGLLFNFFPQGTFNSTFFSPAALSPGAITIAGALANIQGAGVSNGVFFNGGNVGSVQVNVASVGPLVTAIGTSIDIITQGDLAPANQLSSTGIAGASGITAVAGNLSLRSLAGQVAISQPALIQSSGNLFISGQTGVSSTNSAVGFSAGYTPATFDFLTGAGVIVSNGAGLTLTSGAAITLAGSNALVSSGNVNLTAGNGVTLNSGAVLNSGVRIGAGAIAGVPLFALNPTSPVYSTNFASYNSGSIVSPGGVNMTSTAGNILLNDSFVVSIGADTQVLNLTGDITLNTAAGGGNFIFSQGGNALFNALVNITTTPGTSIGAVARIVPNAAPVQIVGNTLPGYSGGDIGMVAGTIIPNFSQFLRQNFDVNRTLQNQYAPSGPLDLTGTPVPTPVNGGYVILSNPSIVPMVITNSSFNVDGSVIYIDPVVINGTGFGAFGIPSAFVPAVPAVPAPAPGAPAPPPVAPPALPAVAVPSANSSTILSTDTDAQNRQVPLNNETTEVISIVDMDETMVITSACQQFVVLLKDPKGNVYATVIAAGGTILRTEKVSLPNRPSLEERMLSIKEGKIVVISGEKKGLSMKVTNGVLAIPADGVSVVEAKRSGAVIAGLIIGPHELKATVVGYSGESHLLARQGEEFAFGDELEPEELIAADGAGRELIEARVVKLNPDFESSRGTVSAGRGSLRQQARSLRIESRKYDSQERIRKEKLLLCLDCVRAKCSKEQCLRLLKKLELNQPLTALPGSPMRPVGSFVGVVKPAANLVTTHLPTAVIKHVTGAVETKSRDLLSLSPGEYLISANGSTTVQLDMARVQMASGTIALLKLDDEGLSVVNLWDNHANSLTVKAAERLILLAPGQEAVVAHGSELPVSIVRNSAVARRLVRSHELGRDKALMTAEVSFSSLHFASPVLRSLRQSDLVADRVVLARVSKMAAVLGVATARHGQFHSGK